MNREEYEKKAVSIVMEWTEKRNKIILEYVKELKSTIEYIVRTEVDAFYEDYPKPDNNSNPYNREYSLYKILKVDINVEKDEMTVLLGSENMDASTNKYRRLSNEDIYINSIKLGWHGGAIPKKSGAKTIYGNQVVSGIPYWRIGTDKNHWSYTHWYKPAKVMSKPPFESIKERWEKESKEIQRRYQSRLDQCDEKYGNKCINLIKRFERN